MNTIKGLLIAATTMVALGASQLTLAQGTPSPEADNVRAHADLIRAKGEYEKALAEARLLYAKANLVDAQTAGEWERVRELKLLVNRAELELRRLRHDEGQLRRKVEAIESHARAAQVILTGRVSATGLRSLAYLQINAIDPQISFEAMTTEIPAIDPSEFEGTRATVEFNGTNVGQLLDHLRRNNLTVRPWGVAHQAIAAALVTMSSGVTEKLQHVQERLDQLRDSVDPFDLPDNPLAGV